ncbi:MAG: Mut7-C RNAse domain-containing protein [Endomicrobiales bacterium]|nr:Mut7-C RNAse domain-containing protein [Endomicrobiales bacterium]
MRNNQKPKFLVDFMLGRLAKWLRIFGYDSIYIEEKNRPNLILNSLKENRILITRDHRLSKKRAWKLILIKNDHLPQQIKQLKDELNIVISRDNLFSRCTICNAPIEKIEDKEKIKDLVPEYVFRTQNDFSRCPNCKRIYWSGTHWELLIKDLQKAGIKI